MLLDHAPTGAASMAVLDVTSEEDHGNFVELIRDSDVVVSLVPPSLHTAVAQNCIQVMLAQKARNEGLEVDAMFVGEGDLLPTLQRLADGNAFIHVRTTMEQEMLASLLGTCHLGLLPMPKRTAWMLASPLKRSEFLASGLPVFGIDHQGHRLAGVDSAWFTLAAQEDFHADGLEVLRRHMDANGQHSAAARAYAETNLGWSISVDALMRVLSDLVSISDAN